MFTMISFFQRLFQRGVEIKAGVLENFSKIDKRWGTIIRYLRVQTFVENKRIFAKGVMYQIVKSDTPFSQNLCKISSVLSTRMLRPNRSMHS